MLVKDLTILFQALNEGVINVLEHYFEMSHVDAESALSIYRKFCRQTEKVMEYLAIAKKLQNLLNVPVPNLRHVGFFFHLHHRLRAHMYIPRRPCLWSQH